MTQPPSDATGVALGLLRSGRGVPVHAEAFGRMARRWERLRDQLDGYRFRLERNGGVHDKPDLIQDVADAAAACDILLTGGMPYDNPPVPPRPAVAYADVARWFDDTRREVFRSLPEVPDQEFVARVDAIHQRGVEVLYELDATSVPAPSRDDTAVRLLDSTYASVQGEIQDEQGERPGRLDRRAGRGERDR